MCQQGFECSKEKGNSTSNGQPNSEPNQHVEGSNASNGYVFTTLENDAQVFNTPLTMITRSRTNRTHKNLEGILLSREVNPPPRFQSATGQDPLLYSQPGFQTSVHDRYQVSISKPNRYLSSILILFHKYVICFRP